MNRIHIHIKVDDPAAAKEFYSALFGTVPSVDKPDYAKWSLMNPRVNFAISYEPGRKAGIDHLGIQVDDDGALRAMEARLQQAGQPAQSENAATCCYAKSDKVWTTDPTGVVWEMFHTMAEAVTYGDDRGPEPGMPARQSIRAKARQMQHDQARRD